VLTDTKLIDGPVAPAAITMIDDRPMIMIETATVLIA
jgi:hypothetical protein